MMDDDLRQLDGVLRDRAAEVPQVQDVPPTMVARARRRVARNAVVFAFATLTSAIDARTDAPLSMSGARFARFDAFGSRVAATRSTA